MSISYRKLDLSVSADGSTVMLFGQEMTTKYFIEIVATTMLNSTGADESKSNRILNDIHAAGLNAGDFGKYSQWWARSNAEARERAEHERREAQKNLERIRDMLATPAEIAAEAAKKREREERMERMYGRKGHEFGL
ncbi:hypothetical protein N4684_02650 [Escherichia coli]|uniref:DUF6971 family protein n=1 Tax=Escherichia coli TaxID=562 RepID=UPI000D0AC358|nr:hypothetical protein [Escherichia coli]MCU6881200.1 hypothetical protein [Escherichia coli]MCU6963400.1 hypothetical protein [Escherichia coli]HCJ5570824.1 hypothetical protein [Escherichia coli]HCT3219342.1 hypothetical protein [Escherichia coli]